MKTMQHPRTINTHNLSWGNRVRRASQVASFLSLCSGVLLAAGCGSGTGTKAPDAQTDGVVAKLDGGPGLDSSPGVDLGVTPDLGTKADLASVADTQTAVDMAPVGDSARSVDGSAVLDVATSLDVAQLADVAGGTDAPEQTDAAKVVDAGNTADLGSAGATGTDGGQGTGGSTGTGGAQGTGGSTGTGGAGGGGSGILFVQGANAWGNIYRVDPDTAVSTKLGTFDRFQAVSWSPDGSTIASVKSGGTIATTGVFLLGLDGSDLSKVPNANGGSVEWFPSGTSLLMGYLDAITRINTDGSNLVSIATGNFGNEVAISPDGSKVAFVENSGLNYAIMVADATNGASKIDLTTRVLNPSATGMKVISVTSPIWVSNTQILFGISNIIGAKTGFDAGTYQVAADGSADPVKQTALSARLPNGSLFSFSPDKSMIAYVKDSKLYKVAADGSAAPTQLSTDANGPVYGTVPSWR
jgi:Tol biopolymer transport system component